MANFELKKRFLASLISLYVYKFEIYLAKKVAHQVESADRNGRVSTCSRERKVFQN